MAAFDAVPAEGDFPTLQRVLLVRRGAADAGAQVLDGRASARRLHEPLRADRGDDREQLLHRRRAARGRRREPIPIGVALRRRGAARPRRGARARLRQARSGDLYIAGVGLSPGTGVTRRRRTRAFVPDPRSDRRERIYRTGDLARVGDDGLVYFLGRVDSQIKQPRLPDRARRDRDGAQRARTDAGVRRRRRARATASRAPQICCAYAAARGHADRHLSSSAAQLAQTLPRYMLPTRWLALDALPKNANGKIDRRRLKELFLEQTGNVSRPRDSLHARRRGDWDTGARMRKNGTVTDEVKANPPRHSGTSICLRTTRTYSRLVGSTP